MKDLIFNIKIKNSKFKLIIYICNDLSTVAKIIRKKHKTKEPVLSKWEIKHWGGCVICEFENKNLLYILVKRVKGMIPMASLTHEIFHATGRLLIKSIINYYEDEEAYAGLNGYLNSAIMLKLTKSNEKFSYSRHEDIKFVK